MSKPELMTHFDKFVLKVVGGLLVLGIAGIIVTMMNMTISMAKMEAELKYVSERIMEANKDRYTSTMASVDKSLLNSKIQVNSDNLSEVNRKISVIFKKVSDIEKDILLIKKE